MAADLRIAGVRRQRLPGICGGSDLPKRLLHPEINQTSRLFPSLHRRFALIRTTRQCFDQAIDGEPRFSECESRQIKRQLHQSNVEEIVVAVEPLSRFLTQIGPNEDSLRSVQIHFAAEQPKRNRRRRGLGSESLPSH